MKAPESVERISFGHLLTNYFRKFVVMHNRTPNAEPR
jgi:hypothetical protein